ncbi:MAG: hypothetical protein ABSG55_00760 [Dehalococcoidia bacterium]
MRSGAAAALAIVLAVLLSLSGGPKAHGSPDPLIHDGFEPPSGVGSWVATEGTLDTTCPQEGNCFAVLSSNVNSMIQYRGLIPIRALADYAFSADILKSGPEIRSVRLRLVWRDSKGTISSSDSPSPRDNETSWQSLTWTASSPEGAVFVWPKLVVEFDGSGTVYFDDVTLEGPPPLPPTNTPAATDTPAVAPQASTTPMVTVAPAATATRTGSATPTTAPSATPTTGPSDSLVNGGFENADGNGPIGWSKYGGDLQRSSAHARSGQYSGAFSSNTTSTKWAYQTVLVSSGSAYDFGGYVLLDDPGVAEAYLRISWYASEDGSGTALATSDSTAHLSGLDPSFRFLTTDAVFPPADARSARLRVMLAPLSEAPATIYMDDVSFGPAVPPAADTPAPSAASAPADEPPQSDIGVPALIQRVTKPRATVAGQSVMRQATPPASALTPHAAGATQQPKTAVAAEASTSPRPTSDDARRRILISLASGAVALAIGGSSGLFLARLNTRRL